MTKYPFVYQFVKEIYHIGTIAGNGGMRNSRYRRSGRDRRKFSTRIAFQERRCGNDRRRVRDLRTGLDRRNPKVSGGGFPLAGALLPARLR
ncbi:hypothetical protein D3OALGA1CA_2493 [Olavius algarvensis associated proteobacterium Delta 3]|nr:hypothetical protein D3OALGA1CA_2493 [Olavius algarvensis associated proteobacterium Delta 3]CAB5154539.1 hypothetical protein D3OALGB2SA_5016 [Olavius algarvensis associated proteobacterium Delta 3]